MKFLLNNIFKGAMREKASPVCNKNNIKFSFLCRRKPFQPYNRFKCTFPNKRNFLMSKEINKEDDKKRINGIVSGESTKYNIK